MKRLSAVGYVLIGILTAWTCAAPMGDDPGVNDAQAQGTIVPCNVVQIDGKSVNNNTATLNLKQLSLYNTTGHAFSAVSTGGGGAGMIVRGDVERGGTGFFIEGFDGLVATGNYAGSGITGRAGQGGPWNGVPMVAGAAIFADGETKGGGIGLLINSGVLNGQGQPAVAIVADKGPAATGVYIRSHVWPAIHLDGDFNIRGTNMTAH